MKETPVNPKKVASVSSNTKNSKPVSQEAVENLSEGEEENPDQEEAEGEQDLMQDRGKNIA